MIFVALYESRNAARQDIHGPLRRWSDRHLLVIKDRLRVALTTVIRKLSELAKALIKAGHKWSPKLA